jgi:transposase
VKVTCGIDWSEKHHDIALVDGDGQLVARKRVTDNVSGWETLLELFATYGDTPGEQIPVAIETGRGLLVACLRATGRPVYAINPLAVARYRERHTVARSKSDHADAMTLANILRVDRAHHRPLPADSELVQAVAVLARAQQDAVWNRQQLSNQLRSLLREYFPAALKVFQVKGIGLTSREARAVLTAAPTPARAAKLTTARLATTLRRCGRERNIDAWARRLHAAFQQEQLRQLPMVEDSLGRQAQALLLQLDAACLAADQLAEATREVFCQHPDAAIITSFPGPGDLTGAGVLAEIGGDRGRLADARALKATGPRAHYDHRRQVGDRHASALRNTFNRMLGCLFHCLQTGQPYAEATAFGARFPAAA